jgi:hypothetical protein
MGSIAFDKTATCIVVANTKDAPADSEWDEFLAFIGRHLKAGGPPHGLAWSEGGGPSTLQRERLLRLLHTAPDVRIGVVTTSVVVRGITSALSWFHKETKTFAPKDLWAATRFLGLPEGEAKQALGLVEQLRHRLILRV